VLVVAGGRLYVANINGSVIDITGSAGSSAVNWVSGGLPPSASTEGVPQNLVPPGVVEGSRYQPGQQLRVVFEGLNMRAEPNQNGAIIGGVFQGEWVAILAGPYNTSDGIEWWRIQTANRVVGWIAGEIGGTSTLGP
jgi:hypothetical protein